MAVFIVDENANRIITDVCKRVRGMKGGPGIRVVNGPGGITISRDDVGGGSDETGPTEIWAKITDAGTLSSGVYKYAWVQQTQTAAGWTNTTNGLSSTDGTGGLRDSRAVNSLHPTARCYLKLDTVVRLHLAFDGDGIPCHRFEYQRSKTVAVSLTLDTLTSAGTSSTTPSITYKWPVDLETGQEIKKADDSRATGLSPQFSRNIGEYAQGDRGLIYFDSSDNPQLLIVDETEEVCE